MLSRSTLLLRREHRQFELLPLPKVRKIEPYAVAVRRQDEAAYWLNWTLFVVPEDGDYDRTEIQVNISFKEDYDRSPPVFSLANIVFHPNVDPTSGDVSMAAAV